MGVSMISPDGLAIRPRIPAQADDLRGTTTSTRVGHDEDGVESSRVSSSVPLDQDGLTDGFHHALGDGITLARSQMSTTLLYRSPLVMRPSRTAARSL